MPATMVKPESETKIADMFNRIAPTYDFLNRLLSARQDVRWRKQMVSMFSKDKSLFVQESLQASEPFKVLDMATGTADVLIEVHRQYGHSVTLFGGDISHEMLERGKLKLKAATGMSQDLSIMSAERIPFANDSFDFITISFGLRNVVEKDRAIAEFYRVLKPGGRLFVLEFFIPESGLFAHLFQFYFNRILPVIGGIFSDKSAYHYLPKSVVNSYSLEKLCSVMANKGLRRGRVKNFLFGACKIVEGIKV